MYVVFEAHDGVKLEMNASEEANNKELKLSSLLSQLSNLYVFRIDTIDDMVILKNMFKGNQEDNIVTKHNGVIVDNDMEAINKLLKHVCDGTNYDFSSRYFNIYTLRNEAFNIVDLSRCSNVMTSTKIKGGCCC